MALSPTRVQRVSDQVGVLVRYMPVSEFVEDSIVPAGLAEEGGRVPAVAGIRALNDQLVVHHGREAAPAPSLAATAHEKLISLIFCLQPAYVEACSYHGGGERGAHE